MAQRIRMRNIKDGSIKMMPEATSKLATIRSRWVVEDPTIETKAAKDDEPVVNENLTTEADSKESLPTETAEVKEAPKPKPKAKRKSTKK